MQITINVNDAHTERVKASFSANFPDVEKPVEKGLENFIVAFVARFEQAQKQSQIQQEPDTDIIVNPS